ncbi:unnamed protein product [Protopolystoma xenopodis]|uniref:Secreted protein n=1 Tax=Protopolystoma xenopodis TaxID=117903 RepID=A0A3S5BCQ7_9PLAT|nr:unnamed protein product [Protopolystoma xenopodis]
MMKSVWQSSFLLLSIGRVNSQLHTCVSVPLTMDLSAQSHTCVLSQEGWNRLEDIQHTECSSYSDHSRLTTDRHDHTILDSSKIAKHVPPFDMKVTLTLKGQMLNATKCAGIRSVSTVGWKPNFSRLHVIHPPLTSHLNGASSSLGFQSIASDSVGRSAVDVGLLLLSAVVTA